MAVELDINNGGATVSILQNYAPEDKGVALFSAQGNHERLGCLMCPGVDIVSFDTGAVGI
jgi:hypothetical protein